MPSGALVCRLIEDQQVAVFFWKNEYFVLTISRTGLNLASLKEKTSNPTGRNPEPKKKKNMKTQSKVIQIPTGTNGIMRIWESVTGWCWATANGSEGSAEPSFEEAVAEAFAAEGLNPEDYGYGKTVGEVAQQSLPLETALRKNSGYRVLMATLGTNGNGGHDALADDLLERDDLAKFEPAKVSAEQFAQHCKDAGWEGVGEAAEFVAYDLHHTNADGYLTGQIERVYIDTAV